MTSSITPDAAILVVDDEPSNIALLRRILTGAGFRNVTSTTDPREAVELFDRVSPDLVLLDLHMPMLDGFAVMEAFERMRDPDAYLPVLVLTADATDAAKRRALVSGAMDFVTKPFDVTEVLLRINNLLRARMLHRQLRSQNRDLTTEVAERARAVQRAHMETADRLTTAAEARDDETGEHIERVGRLSGAIARALGLPDDEADLIGSAARLHDIGKIGVPDHVLLKPGRLDALEFEQMRAHTIIGAGILARSASPVLQVAAEIALSHHERWNGSGYPRGLAGEHIPLSGRIVAVADAFDAMTHHRRYQAARPSSDALEEILRERGRQFDPTAASALIRILATQTPRA